MKRLLERWPIWAALLFHVLAIAFVVRDARGPRERRVTFSAGDLQVVHAPVSVAGRPASGVRRFGVGDAIETGRDGRGRARLDDGTVLVLDRDTRVVVDAKGPRVERGRVVVEGADAGRPTVSVAGAELVVTGATAAVDAGAKRVTCSKGELVVTQGGEHRVHAGEAATLGGEVKVVPETVFLDWTGGMTTPWGADGPPRAAIGELWGRTGAGDDAGSPLAIRAHAVDVRVDGELATTRVATTYFNAGNGRVVGDFRMALPPTALVSRFAEESRGKTREGHVAVAKDDGPSADSKLEWAGDGWVRAQTTPLDAGATLTVILEYVEWLPVDGDTVTYRYPMVGAPRGASMGELRVRVDAGPSSPVAIHAPQGADVRGAVIELTRADARPAADFVVELSLPPSTLRGARAYVAPPLAADPAGPYVFVRTRVPPAPPAAGVTLAVVVDTSLSVGPSLLDAERALVEALLLGLGADDRVIVLAADQDQRPVGPATIGPVDAKRRAEVLGALTALAPAGATDLGAALERAADALPKGAPDAMVLYVGDGWATAGETTMEAVRARLSRRRGGVPRLGAVAVGPMANRFGLTALVRGSGPVLEIADRRGAAEVAVSLLSLALRPTVAGVELDLGPHIERVYPRGARAHQAGGSAYAVGRLRGPMPASVKLRFLRGDVSVEEPRMLIQTPMPQLGDVRRRWAEARVEELALRGEGREVTVDAAQKTQLLTPWTAWILGGQTYNPSPLELRVLDLAAMRAAPLSARLATPPAAQGALAEPPGDLSSKGADEDLDRATIAAARRAIDDASDSIRACRDARAGLRPELSGPLRISIKLGGDGAPKKVTVSAASARDDDPALDRCVELVVRGLTYFESGRTAELVILHEVRLPPVRPTRVTTCSRASTLPLGARRGVWRDRLRRAPAADAYVAAKQSCELPTWTDRRALLELLLDAVPRGVARVELARALVDRGEQEAADLVRREAVRRATSPAELHQTRFALIGDERLAHGAFKKQYGDARGDDGRLAVTRRFLVLAPHDGLVLGRLFALLERRGDKAGLVAEIARARQDPFVDAAVLADGASALLRLGDAAESRRAFGELVERAPADPFAHAFLGDRLRAEGLFDAATTAYTTLSALDPSDPSTTLRLALAHAGAGRVDVASRLLARVATTGGARAEPRHALLASALGMALLQGARSSASEVTRAVLTRREEALPQPALGYVLVRGGSLDHGVEARLLRGKAGDVEAPFDASATGLGLHVVRVEEGEGRLKVRLRRAPELAPSRALPVRIDLVRAGQPLVTKQIDLAADGEPVDLRWDGSSW